MGCQPVKSAGVINTLFQGSLSKRMDHCCYNHYVESFAGDYACSILVLMNPWYVEPYLDLNLTLGWESWEEQELHSQMLELDSWQLKCWQVQKQQGSSMLETHHRTNLIQMGCVRENGWGVRGTYIWNSADNPSNTHQSLARTMEDGCSGDSRSLQKPTNEKMEAAKLSQGKNS